MPSGTAGLEPQPPHPADEWAKDFARWTLWREIDKITKIEWVIQNNDDRRMLRERRFALEDLIGQLFK